MPEIDRNQLALPNHAELVPETLYPGLEPEQRLAFISLLVLTGATVRHSGRLRIEDYRNAETANLKRGLYLHPSHPAYATAQHLVTSGVKPVRYNPGTGIRDFGVAFPFTEYKDIVMYPKAYGERTYNRTKATRVLAQNEGRRPAASRSTNNDAAMRSAGHALISLGVRQRKLIVDYKNEIQIYKELMNDISRPAGARYQLRNLEPKRVLADEKIHEAAETSSATRRLNDQQISGLHKVVKKTLYNGNYSATEFAYNWLTWIALIGNYTVAKLDKAEQAHAIDQKQLERYQPYLDKEAKRLEMLATQERQAMQAVA